MAAAVGVEAGPSAAPPGPCGIGSHIRGRSEACDRNATVRRLQRFSTTTRSRTARSRRRARGRCPSPARNQDCPLQVRVGALLESWGVASCTSSVAGRTFSTMAGTPRHHQSGRARLLGDRQLAPAEAERPAVGADDGSFGLVVLRLAAQELDLRLALSGQGAPASTPRYPACTAPPRFFFQALNSSRAALTLSRVALRRLKLSLARSSSRLSCSWRVLATQLEHGTPMQTSRC